VRRSSSIEGKGEVTIIVLTLVDRKTGGRHTGVDTIGHPEER
jgi:hypothetical protein